MSKIVEIHLRCSCGATFSASLFTSIWIEDPENRSLIFEDRINVVECPACKTRSRAPLSLLATNSPRAFAVWYEPEPDSGIDEQCALYAQVMGQETYLAAAPRIPDWNEFKRTILRFESGELKGKSMSQFDFSKLGLDLTIPIEPAE